MPKKGKKGAKGGAVEAESGLKDTSAETQPELDVISPEEHDGMPPKAEPGEAPAATPEATAAATYPEETVIEASDRPKAPEPEVLLTPQQPQQLSTPEQREPAPETESPTTEQQQQTEVKAAELVAPTPAPVVPMAPAAVRQASLQHEEGEKKPEVPPPAPKIKVGNEERPASIPTQRPSQEQPPAQAPPAIRPEQKQPETSPAIEHGVTPALPKAPEHTPPAQAPVGNNNAAAAGHCATTDRLGVAVKGVKVVKGQRTLFFVIPVSDDHLEFTIEAQLPGPGGKTLTKTTRYNDVLSLHNAMRSTHFMTKETAALFPPKGRHSMSPNDPFIKSRNASFVSYFQALLSQREALRDPAMRLFFKV